MTARLSPASLNRTATIRPLVRTGRGDTYGEPRTVRCRIRSERRIAPTLDAQGRELVSRTVLVLHRDTPPPQRGDQVVTDEGEEGNVTEVRTIDHRRYTAWREVVIE